jgi:hypothetical protein
MGFVRVFVHVCCCSMMVETDVDCPPTVVFDGAACSHVMVWKDPGYRLLIVRDMLLDNFASKVGFSFSMSARPMGGVEVDTGITSCYVTRG